MQVLLNALHLSVAAEWPWGCPYLHGLLGHECLDWYYMLHVTGRYVSLVC